MSEDRIVQFAYPTDPAQAAGALQGGAAIEWQPGTGCRHVVAIVDNPARPGAPMLVGLEGASKATILFPRGHVEDREVDGKWVRVFEPQRMILVNWIDQIPKGEWACFRPLLCALGWAQGKPEINQYDSQDEYRIRLEDEAGTGGIMDEAKLGRIVRLAVNSMRDEAREEE